MPALTDLLRDASIPLFAIHPRHWAGAVFVADTLATSGVAAQLVQIAYLPAAEPAASGVMVSNVDASLPAERGSDPLERHLLSFVSRFDRAFVPRFSRRRRSPWRQESFRRRDLVLMIAGEERGSHWFAHVDQPLQVIRTAIRVGERITDLVVAGWDEDVRDLAPLIEPVTPALAAAVDEPRAPGM